MSLRLHCDKCDESHSPWYPCQFSQQEPRDDTAAWLAASIAILTGDDPDTLRRVIRMAERRIAEIEASVNRKGGMSNG